MLGLWQSRYLLTNPWSFIGQHNFIPLIWLVDRSNTPCRVLERYFLMLIVNYLFPQRKKTSKYVLRQQNQGLIFILNLFHTHIFKTPASVELRRMQFPFFFFKNSCVCVCVSQKETIWQWLPGDLLFRMNGGFRLILIMWILTNDRVHFIYLSRAQPWFNVHVIQEYLNLTGKPTRPPRLPPPFPPPHFYSFRNKTLEIFKNVSSLILNKIRKFFVWII